MTVKLCGITVLSTKYTDVGTSEQCFIKYWILTSQKQAYTRWAMAAIEKPWGLKHKLDLEEDKEQNTSEVQVLT